MSVVATIGYAAFIAGPPLLGFLGDHVGVLKSLLVVGAGAILVLLMVPSAGPSLSSKLRRPSRATRRPGRPGTGHSTTLNRPLGRP